MVEKCSFGRALKMIRLKKGLTQEDFSLVSSRTYISALERGKKSPTLDKIELIAETLGVSPLALLTIAYSPDNNIFNAVEQIEVVKKDLESLM